MNMECVGVFMYTVSLSSDGRESAVVTKVFLVEPVSNGETGHCGTKQGDEPDSAYLATRTENRSGDATGRSRLCCGVKLVMLCFF